ncbi:MAG TPA: Ig-like domain-containing protein, partial [Brevibacillus sp.]|nr:Ig-like domain-containing protein [Brevibacillus sp.]
MKTITKLRNWWKRPLAFILLLALVASSFSMAVVPERVQAAEPIKWLTYKFDINDFSNPSLQQLFQLNGNSTILDGKLMVTEKKASQTGSVFNKQSFQPHEEFSFSTGFSFRIDGNPPNTADGMTFAIVGDPTKLGLYGGHLGLAGVKPSLGIKFDTYQNNSSSAVYKDPSNNYIGIAYNGNLVNDNPSWYKNLNDVTDESGNPKFVLANGNTYYAWIDYDGASSNVKVYLNDSASKPSDPLIDANGINLKQIFGDANGIYAGFTGSTSSWFESHEVLSWYFVNDFAPIQDNFGTPEGSSDYQQAPSSIDMTVEKSDNPGKHKVVVTAYNPDGSAATEVPITLTNSKEGSWTDTDGNPITDWSVVKTDSEGKVTVYFTPDNALDATDVRAVAVGGAIATGTISAVAPTPQDVTLEKVETGTNEIVITFDQEIATGAATDGFVVTAGDQQEVVEISEIVVEGNRVTLKLSKELKPNDIVNLKYTKPLEGNLKGKNGAFVLDFEKEVKNNLIELPTSSDFYVSSIYGDDATGDGTRDKPYATLNKAYAEVNNGGTIYILDNITLTGGVDVVVGINEAKHITISTAPNVENTTVIKRGQPSGKVLFQLTNNSQLTLRNIIIDGNLEGGAIDGRLFNVYSGSKLIIDEGAILENSYSQHIGSAIYINNSTNTGTVVEMIGGEIRGNKSLKAPGGAVAVDSGAFIMTGGLITDNTGGGVQSRGGQISLSGEASITGNTTSGKEMNVYLANHKTLNLAGAFTGEAGITTDSMVPGAEFGQATEEGLGSIENLIADSGALLAGYDDVKKVLVWRLFKNELSQPSKDDEIIGKRPTLKGVTEPNATVTIKIVSAKDPSLDITKEVTADANGNWVLAVSETLETGKYTTQVTAKKNKTQSEPVTRSFEIVDNVYVSSGGNDTTGDGTPRNPYATLKKAYAEVKDGGTIYLLDDITVLPDATGKMIDLNSDKRVTITTATGVDETAVIRRGQPNGQINTIFGLTKGELTLKNIIIDGNFEGKEINGRLFNVYGGSKLIIEEGSILQNSFSQHPGSAIHITTGSVVEMKGGEIRGNKRASTGAAVAVDSGAKFYMTGGLITDNIGGGVQSRGTNGGEIYLSGEARITGNTDSGKGKNVNLENNKTLILNGAFTGEAGITTQNMVPGTQFGRVTEDGLGSIENLIADYGPLLASYDQNNVLVWRLFKNELSQPSTDGEITGTNPTLSGVTEPFAKVTIKIVSADDPSFVINEERTADENGNWELPIDNALNIGAYTITVTANKNKTQSNPVTRQFEVVDKTSLQAKFDEITAENLVETEYTEASWTALDEAMKKAEEVLGNPAATQAEVDKAL